MLTWFEIFWIFIACLCVGAIYTIIGYEITNMFTDGPNWKPWEQALFWLVWPIVIPLCLLSMIALILLSIIISIFIAFVTCYELIKSAIKKLSR